MIKFDHVRTQVIEDLAKQGLFTEETELGHRVYNEHNSTMFYTTSLLEIRGYALGIQQYKSGKLNKRKFKKVVDETSIT